MGPQGRFMDAQNYKSVCAKVFDFCKILKMCKKILVNLRSIFVIILYYSNRRCLQKESQLKVS